MVSGQSWEEFLSERIFQPARMGRSLFGGHNRVVPGAVLGYAKREEEWVRSRALSFTRGYGLGGLFSCVDDLAAWDTALRSGALLKSETRERMYTPPVLADGKKSQYALGWRVSRLAGHRVVAHGGAIFGWRAFLLRMPDDGIFVAILTNRESRDQKSPMRLAIEIARALLG